MKNLIKTPGVLVNKDAKPAQLAPNFVQLEFAFIKDVTTSNSCLAEVRASMDGQIQSSDDHSEETPIVSGLSEFNVTGTGNTVTAVEEESPTAMASKSAIY